VAQPEKEKIMKMSRIVIKGFLGIGLCFEASIYRRFSALASDDP
jgi:hypothetical protein